MIYIYKNGKRIKIGDLPLYVYLDSESSVVADSFDKLEGYDRTVEVDGHLYGQIIAKSENKEYYHRLKDGASGRVFSDYEKVYCIQILKNAKYDAIDARTDELIARGIPFDGNLFSTSSEAQRNWIALFSARNELPYPISVTTLDEKEYTFNDARLVALFYLTGVSVINANIASGRIIKLQVGECETKECIDSIVDPR